MPVEQKTPVVKSIDLGGGYFSFTKKQRRRIRKGLASARTIAYWKRQQIKNKREA
jgi:hypothetical protein